MAFARNYCVYCHVAPDGRKYIGLTKLQPTMRWCGGRGYESNNRFFSAIKRYGWDNFEHLILADRLTNLQAGEIEKLLIDYANTTDENNGFNLSKGRSVFSDISIKAYGGIVPVEFLEEMANKLKRETECLAVFQDELAAKANRKRVCCAN